MDHRLREERVELAALLLADHAEVTPGGKVHMTGGGWHIMRAPDLPHRHPHFTIVISLLVPWSRQNEQHEIVIELRDADNANAGLRIAGEFEAGRPPGTREGDFSLHHLAVNIDGMEAKTEGSYHFDVTIDGVHAGTAPLKVVLG